jgi:hypothetical protein
MKKLFVRIATMATVISCLLFVGAAQDIGDIIGRLCDGQADCKVEFLYYYEDNGIGIIIGRFYTDRWRYFILGFYCAGVGECPPAVPNSTP